MVCNPVVVETSVPFQLSHIVILLLLNNSFIQDAFFPIGCLRQRVELTEIIRVVGWVASELSHEILLVKFQLQISENMILRR